MKWFILESKAWLWANVFKVSCLLILCLPALTLSSWQGTERSHVIDLNHVSPLTFLGSPYDQFVVGKELSSSDSKSLQSEQCRNMERDQGIEFGKLKIFPTTVFLIAIKRRRWSCLPSYLYFSNVFLLELTRVVLGEGRLLLWSPGFLILESHRCHCKVC